MPVHRGNIVKPREAAAAPTVEFPSAESGLWTLVMTGLDSHLQSEDKQVTNHHISCILYLYLKPPSCLLFCKYVNEILQSHS